MQPVAMCTVHGEYIASVLTANCLIWGNDIQLARCEADYNQTTDNQKQNIHNNYIGMTEKQKQRPIKFLQIHSNAIENVPKVLWIKQR